jgi:TonB-linked SusC/RagA family outer membrane protein
MKRRFAVLCGSVLALLSSPSWAQTAPEEPRVIRGRVYDVLTDEAVPLARVLIDGTKTGVEADVEGRFQLQIPAGKVWLHVSSAEHKPKKVQLQAEQSEITIPMELSFVDEIVVVGRATETARKHLANAVATVSEAAIQRAPAATLDQALQGKISGANVQSNSGAPGGGLQLRLRGVSTLIGDTTPLYVVDGVLISDAAIRSGANAVTRSAAGSNPADQDNMVNRIADLNPNDIESVEVLKGPSAAAIFGSKASNGVVIINTKTGKQGQPRVDLTQRLGVYQLANKLGARQFETLEEAVAVHGDLAKDHYVPGRIYDHEQQLAGRQDLSHETLASFSGATGDTRYFASALVKNDEGIIANTGYEKQSFRLNLSHAFSDAFEISTNANLIHSLAGRGLTNNDNASITYHMVLPETPSFVELRGQNGAFSSNPFIPNQANPLQTAALVLNDEDVWRVIGSANAVYSPIKTLNHELKLIGVFGLDRFQQDNTLFFPPELFFEPADGAIGTSLSGTSEVRNLNGGLNAVHIYRPDSDTWRLTTSLGAQVEDRSLSSRYIVSRNLNAGQQNVDSGTQVQVSHFRGLVRDRGYYVQEEALLFDQKVSLTGALRGEQSSANGNPNRVHYYPKLGAAYLLPRFVSALDELKLRVAYGESGGVPRPRNKFTPLNAAQNTEGNPGILVAGVLGDADVRPERQREIEAGVDVMFWGGSAVVELSAYQRLSSDLLLERRTGPSLGYSVEYFNGGEMINRGVEAMLWLNPFKTGDFNWTSSTTFALNRGVVTRLEGVGAEGYSFGGFGSNYGEFRLAEGKSPTQIVGTVGSQSNVKLGDTEPTFRMGFANSFSYGPLSLDTLLEWQSGSSVINITRQMYDAMENSADYETAGKERLNRWQNEQGEFDARTYVEDASFLKVREINLSYQLPDGLARRLPGVKTARMSLSGRNLITFTRYSGLDPEVSNFGNVALARNMDVAPFPPSRSYWFSMNLGF